MSELIDAYNEAKDFLGFGPGDVANLQSLAPIFAEKGPAITDTFYEALGQNPATAAFIEGRVDQLKATHIRWMGELFAGDYGATYFENRIRIGHVHVAIGLDPNYVEMVMSFLRTAALEAIMDAYESSKEAGEKYSSVCKILDLDLMAINLAYQAERLDRLTKFTGMSRKLIENCIKRAEKKK